MFGLYWPKQVKRYFLLLTCILERLFQWGQLKLQTIISYLFTIFVFLISADVPRYKLRAESTSSIGLADIIQTPVLDPKIGEGLSAGQAKAVLDYFISCGDRLSQMTKTYNDVEAVTNLLQVS